MTRKTMIDYIEEVCEEYGYEDCQAYDLIYETIKGRSYDDARDVIFEMLKNYNN